MAASGNMNVPNLDTDNSRVISLRSMRNVVLLYDLNTIETPTVDIRNTYLTEHTTQKIVLNSEPEF